MNNGKVRIYELSRELNLENRDILAVCEQLNIPVKSHSSTISEDEAHRIEKFVMNHPEKANGAAKTKEKQAASELGNPSNAKKKQEILEIRKQPYRNNNNQVGGQTLLEDSAFPNAQSSSDANQNKQMMLNRPARNNDSDPSLPDSQNLEEEFSAQDEANTTDLAPERNPERVSEPEGDHIDGNNPLSEEDLQELQAPPVRPVRSSDRKIESGKMDRPVLKPLSKKDESPSPGAAKTPSPSSPGMPRAAKPGAPTRPAPSAPSAPTPSVSKEGDSRRESPQAGIAPKPKPATELVRPRRSGEGDTAIAKAKDLRDRSSSDEDVSNTESESFSEDDNETPRPQLKTPPRPPKRVKKRKDEEDEMQDLDEKSGKGVTKSKRRLKPLADEDDDDDDNDLETDESSDTALSLSIARPPKPKTAPAPRTGAIIPARQTKKPNTNRDSSGSSKSRGRRQEKVEKKERPDHIVITQAMTVRELANALAVPETDIVKTLFFKGIAVNITQTLDIPSAKMVAEELEVTVEIAVAESEAKKVSEMIDISDLESLQIRPPVVTIMGHVDHGKTTLLDSIRKTKVAQGEAGGITQHIGAYHVDVEHKGKMHQVVFLDTPGHEAFTAMRARGTRVTDIAVLVVAADDGVQPQTIEAISHAKAAEVPIVVAINKIDKMGSDLNRVKQELMNYGLVPEEFGGETIMVPVSAIQGQNLDTLLEMIILVAEIEEISANPNRAAKGTVIEAHLDKARGPVATLLVQNGTLHIGDILVAGSTMGKVRAMVGDRGDRVEVATPSFAVEVLGLNEVPSAGDEFDVFSNEKDARAVADDRADVNRETRLNQALNSRRVTLNSLSARAQEGQLKELNLILKADVQGSIEAIIGSLKQLPQNEVQVRVLLAAPGEVSETDVDLAAASDAVIVGFNTTFASGARQAADRAGVDVREYNIIYNLLDDIQAAMEGLLDPELIEEPLGQAEVRVVFQIGRGAVAGCYVLSGKMIRNCKVRVHRKADVIYEGVLDSLKRVKDDAKEVNSGFECGMGIDKFSTWVEGDTIEAYRMVTKRRTLTPV
ncbi:translation initiation factor IF-2 [Phormidium pseudopriestleyi FRX01]|uniref:Translation initiation factor IF-2 n=1 Tax=Phormidium pseudopriestleyi FRX01 TaxID=1759528 RepID=A0ABS3FNC7_9CYAN|nr:translation initiation factor IF-2 [Phormidium pseudopriestleyi]MBO0348474.1 translation initiation factor IF-2 [Phormidium pseudopriestleyi FRX01]